MILNRFFPALLMFCLLTAQIVQADALDAYIGSWQGKGRLTEPESGVERAVLCRMTGERKAARELSLMLRCASRQDSQTLRLSIVYGAEGQIKRFEIAQPAKIVRGAVRLRQDGASLTLLGENDEQLTFEPQAETMCLIFDAGDQGNGQILIHPQ